MKKIKLVLFLSTILLATGCEAHYNLTINENEMIESTNFLLDNNKENKNILKPYLDSTYMAYYNMDYKRAENYTSKKIDNNEKIGMSLSYIYTDDNLQKSSLLDRCYYQKSIIKTEKEIIITTDGKTRCFYKDEDKLLDKLVINIRTDLEVIENNADKVTDDAYTWIIDEDNLNDHPIYMKISLEKDKNSIFGLIALCALGIFVLIGASLLIFIYYKKQKNNRL